MMLTTSEYAAWRGCSGSFVRRLRREGRLVVDANGLIDRDASDKLIAETRDPLRGGDRTGKHAARAAAKLLANPAEIANAAAPNAHAPASQYIPSAQHPTAAESPQNTPSESRATYPPSASSVPPMFGPHSPNAQRDIARDETALAFSSDDIRAAIHRERKANAGLAELKLGQAAGKLILAADAERLVFTAARTAVENLRSMGSRISAILAAETDPRKCEAILDAEIRRICLEMQKIAADLRPQPAAPVQAAA